MIITIDSVLGDKSFPQKNYQKFHAPTGRITFGKKSGEIYLNFRQNSLFVKREGCFISGC